MCKQSLEYALCERFLIFVNQNKVIFIKFGAECMGNAIKVPFNLNERPYCSYTTQRELFCTEV